MPFRSTRKDQERVHKMKISEMFLKPIQREIQGVIRVGQDDTQYLRQEIEEYVLTAEAGAHLERLLQLYTGADLHPESAGVWVSGFFGSGKSHFIKMLACLLQHYQLDGVDALAEFAGKTTSPQLQKLLGEVASIPADVILFNIDAIAPADARNKPDVMLRVFLRAFYDYLGYFGSRPVIAMFEEQLVEEGLYDAFKATILEKEKRPWEELRKNALLKKRQVADAYAAVGGDREDVERFFSMLDSSLTLSISDFAEKVKKYLKSKSPEHRFVFIIDEVGQFIADDVNLMLDLQTFAEELGNKCGGSAWLVVTSQEAIDAVSNVNGRDFSKIAGRFRTRLSLTGANVDEVIKRRLLAKTPVATQSLQVFHHTNAAALRNLFTFAPGEATAEFTGFTDDAEFAQVYPFIPYQFFLLQKVLECVRLYNYAGAHVSMGERSMLASYQEAARVIAEEQEGALIPFSGMYETIQSVLETHVRNVFERAGRNDRLQPQDLAVLRTLFMIRHVGDMLQATLDNLTCLLITRVDEDKYLLRQEVQESLKRLEDEMFIRCLGDSWQFLTNEEQDIEREIAATPVDLGEMVKLIGDQLINEIYDKRTYQVNDKIAMTTNYYVDEIAVYAAPGSELGIRFITPLKAVPENLVFTEYAFKSANTPDAYFLLDAGDSQWLGELERSLKIEVYKRKNTTTSDLDGRKEILSAKGEEMKRRRERGTEGLRKAVQKARVFACGAEVEAVSGSVADVIKSGMGSVVRGFFTKLDYITAYAGDASSVATALQQGRFAGAASGNSLAEEELLYHLQGASSHIYRSILLKFRARPYGWRELDIQLLVAELIAGRKLSPQYAGTEIDRADKVLVDYLTRSTHFDKLVLVPRLELPRELLDYARQLALELFQHSTLPADEDAVFTWLKKAMAQRVVEITQKQSRLQQEPELPGKHILHQALTSYRQIAEMADRTQFFHALPQVGPELIAQAPLLENAMNFFGAPTEEHFKKSLRLLAIYRDNASYCDNADLARYTEELEQVVTATEPYSQLHRLPQLNQDFSDCWVNLLETASQPLNQALDTVKAKLLEQAGVMLRDPADFNKKIIDDLLAKKAQVEKAQSLIQLTALEADIAKLFTAGQAAIVQQHNAELIPPVDQPAPDTSGGPPAAPVVIIHASALPVAPTMADEAQIDAYLANLKGRLMQEIAAGKQILLQLS